MNAGFVSFRVVVRRDFSALTCRNVKKERERDALGELLHRACTTKNVTVVIISYRDRCHRCCLLPRPRSQRANRSFAQNYYSYSLATIRFLHIYINGCDGCKYRPSFSFPRGRTETTRPPTIAEQRDGVRLRRHQETSDFL